MKRITLLVTTNSGQELQFYFFDYEQMFKAMGDILEFEPDVIEALDETA